MEFSRLADLYEKLDSTTKKLEKRYILSGFYKSCPQKDMYKAVLLSMGAVFPRGEQELGVAEGMIKRAIMRVTGSSEKEVVEKFKTTGDLGLAVEKLMEKRKQRSFAKRHLAIDRVFDNLRKLPEMTGKGSQDRKIELVSELLTSASPKEARYIVRTTLGQMRIGVAEGIVRDAIAKAFGQDPKKIEKIHDIVGDYGRVAEMAKRGRLKAGVEVGRALRVMLADRAPDLREAVGKFENPAIETKYDGFRCISGHTGIYTNSHGLKSVKDLKVGDNVLTHKGRFKKVVAVNIRKIDKKERLFRFQSFMGNEFKISEGHPILCKRGNNVIWLQSEDVTKDDLLVFPLPKLYKKYLHNSMILEDLGYKKEINLNEKFFRFLGYWIGDGFTNEYHHTERVGLIFNSKHKKLLKEYKKIIKDVFGIMEISEYAHKNNAISIYWRDKPLRIWLSKNFRLEWKGKTIPEWFVNVSDQNFKAFLRGWIESDGHKSEHGTVIITTQEKILASRAQIIGIMHSIPLGLRKVMVQMPKRNYRKEYYKVIIPNSTKFSFCDGKYTYFKILKKEEVARPDPRTLLYNIQVEDDESYCTNNIVLHNCQIHKNDNEVKIFSRRMEDVTKQFPDIASYAKDSLGAKSCIVEGEALAIVGGMPQPFQLLSRRIQRKYDIEKMARDIPVQVNLFDLLYLNGESYVDRPLRERWGALCKITKQTKSFRLADHLETKNFAAADKFYKSSVAAGQEGVIVKNLDAHYQPGKRVGYWLKVKPILEPLDLVVVGAEWGEGKRAKWLSSVILAARKDSGLATTGRMSSGFTEEQLEELTKTLKPLTTKEDGKVVHVKPQVVIEIGYEEIQRSPKYESGYALRFPRLLRLRTQEKKPEDANTVKDIEKLFRQQRGRKK